MNMEPIFVTEGDVLALPAGRNVKPGDLIVANGIAGVALVNGATGTRVQCRVHGVVHVPKATVNAESDFLKSAG
jgi:predicted RecA/RadA family phage recombinase